VFQSNGAEMQGEKFPPTPLNLKIFFSPPPNWVSAFSPQSLEKKKKKRVKKSKRE